MQLTRENTVILESPAKINLGLRIVGRRADGYHLLESLFVPLSLVDTLEFSPADRLSVAMEWEEALGESPTWDLTARTPLPVESDNLVYRALLRADRPARVRITKRIPLGGGLGGGSSNAATALRWAGQANDPVAAARLGADVPFFLQPQAAWITGIGENIRRVDLPPSLSGASFLLVFPDRGLSTPDVFRCYQASAHPYAPSFDGPASWPTPWSENAVQRLFKWADNDLESPAVQLWPQLGEILAELRRLPALHAGMSGSGTTCYALFSDRAAAAQSIQDLDAFFRKRLCRSMVAEVYRPSSVSGDSYGNHRGQSLPG